MGKLFQFEDGVPMRFFIARGSLSNLPTTIETLGGEMSNPFHAHFALMDDGKEVTAEMRHLPAQLVNSRWVQQSKSAGRIRPIYAYICEASPGSREDGLAGLGESARDVAELVKAVIDLNGAVPDREMYEILHRKYPHQTSQQWESLYKGNAPKIDAAISVVKADLEKKLDDCITFLLCGQMEEGEEGTLMMDEEVTLFTREGDMEIEEDESAPTKDGIPMRTDDDATDDHDLTSLSGSSEDAEGDADFDKQTFVATSHHGAVVRRGKGNGPRYTEAEVDAMVDFLVSQGFTDTSDHVRPKLWSVFAKEDPRRNTHTPEAWAAYFYRHKIHLLTRAGSQALAKQQPQKQPLPAERQLSVSGQAGSSKQEIPLPPGWEKFESRRHSGRVFYYHAESERSTWNLTDVLTSSVPGTMTIHPTEG